MKFRCRRPLSRPKGRRRRSSDASSDRHCKMSGSFRPPLLFADTHLACGLLHMSWRSAGRFKCWLSKSYGWASPFQIGVHKHVIGREKPCSELVCGFSGTTGTGVKSADSERAVVPAFAETTGGGPPLKYSPPSSAG